MKRIAIVTGASSGMGAEFARQLGAEPCADEIWLLARRLDRLKEVEAAQNAATAIAATAAISSHTLGLTEFMRCGGTRHRRGLTSVYSELR